MHVHVVTAANRSLYARELEAMHRQRHRIFVDHMGWRALESDDGLDIDEFDTAHTVYFLVLDEQGALKGSDRLNPTWRPHMLSHLLPEFAHQAIPVGPNFWEWSRHAPGDPAWSESLNRYIRILGSIALLEFSASRGVEAFTGVLESKVLPAAMKIGWRPQPLGPPVKYAEGEGVACCCPVNLALLPRLRRVLGRADAVTIELPAQLQARRAVEKAIGVTADLAWRVEAAIDAISGPEPVYQQGGARGRA